MTVADIVERLRKHVAVGCEAYTSWVPIAERLMLDSADKIEAQEAEITRLRSTPDITEAALRKIVGYAEASHELAKRIGTEEFTGTDAETIARDALAALSHRRDGK